MDTYTILERALRQLSVQTMSTNKCTNNQAGDLAGKIALVTGGGSGIGRAVCVLFAEEGAQVAVLDLNKEAAEETAASLCCPSRHMTVACNVTDPQSVDAAVEAVQKRYGAPPQIVVNSAGISGPVTGLLNLDVKDMRTVFQVNTEGTFLVMRAVAKALKHAGIHEGSFVSIGSVGALLCNEGRGHYSASKAAVHTLTKTAAKEWAPLGIRCNSVLPGLVDTPMAHTIGPDEVLNGIAKRLSVLARMGTTQEVAQVILFLASERSSYVTGAEIHVTGGTF